VVRRRAILALVLVVVALSSARCGSATEKVYVPPVDTTNLEAALTLLAKAHLRVELTSFGPLPPGYDLGAAGVGDQEPEASTRVSEGSVVRLNMHSAYPGASPAVRIKHPPTVVVPRLVGLSWLKARERIPSDGLWVQIGRVPGLGPIDPSDVYSAYVVTGQTPAAGTRLPYGGVLLKNRGYRPSIISLQIGILPPND
jgi:beta-lactam-binding protein with PASTA domain